MFHHEVRMPVQTLHMRQILSKIFISVVLTVHGKEVKAKNSIVSMLSVPFAHSSCVKAIPWGNLSRVFSYFNPLF